MGFVLEPGRGRGRVLSAKLSRVSQAVKGALMKPSFTIGIEEEYQTVDPVTRDLRSHIDAEIISKGKLLLKEAVKAEMHQSVVEVGTGICKDIKEAAVEVKQLRRQIIDLAKANNLRLAASGTHPFADWRKQDIYPDERYHTIVEDLKMVARANLIFGLHVHVGVEDRETAIHLMNAARYFLPHILALSTNSPFWLGMDTGLKSYRCKVFDKFPRTNIPDYFPSYGEYESFVNLLIKTNCIDNAKKIWWDIRLHPNFPDARVPGLRCADAGGRNHCAGRADSGDGGEALQAACGQPGLPSLSPRAHHGEQVARRALRHRRQNDRFRQEDRGPRCETSSTNICTLSTTWSTSWARVTKSTMCITFWNTEPAPTASCGSSRKPAISPKSSTTSSTRPKPDWNRSSRSWAGFRKNMTTDLTRWPFDTELLPGAHNAVSVCLRVQPDEKVTLITDEACEEIAAALVQELSAVGCRYNTFVLEQLAPRPLVDMPGIILDDMESSEVSIFAVQAQKNELQNPHADDRRGEPPPHAPRPHGQH